jgi:Flp pilus assembly protein TadG
VTPRLRPPSGQASVELALALPVLVLVLLLVVQAGLVVVDQVAVVEAAREGARAAAVDPSPDAARRAAVTGRLTRGPTDVRVSRGGGAPAAVTVRIVHRSPTDVPLVGPLLPDVTLDAEAVMADETSHPDDRTGG